MKALINLEKGDKININYCRKVCRVKVMANDVINRKIWLRKSYGWFITSDIIYAYRELYDYELLNQ